MIDRSPTRDTPRLSVALYEVAPLFGTRVAETILASVHVRAHQQAGHMDASDPITSPQKILQGGCRPHMTAGRQHVEDGLHNPSQLHRSGPASMRRRGHERFDQGPFGVGEGACVVQYGPAISCRAISVQAIANPSVVANRQNHNPLKSLNYLFRSGSKF